MEFGVEDLTFNYPEGHQAIFQRLSFKGKGPGFFSLFGLSGSGKSTLARIIAGLLKPVSGEALRAPDIRVLYTHNQERLPLWESCTQHLKDVTPRGQASILDEFKQVAMEDVDLATRFKRLSLGQKNRVNLARYIVQDFDLLIIDEALSNVDEPTRESILGFLKEKFPDRTFLYISHNVVEVARYSKVIYVLVPPCDGKPSSITEIEGLDLKPHQEGPGAEEVEETGLKILQAVSR